MEPASIIRKWGLPVVLLCGLVGFFASGLHDLLSWQTVTLHYAEINHLTQQNWLASYAGFAVLYIAVVAFSLPIASLLTLAAGALIGWPAIALIVLAATAGASLVFIAARGLFRDLLRARAGAFFATVELGFTNNAFSFLLFLRLMPVVPFWAVNILPAFTRMALPQFIAATAIGIIPGTSVYVAVGRGFDRVLARGGTPDLVALSSPQIWLPLAGLAVLALMPVLYRYVTSIRSKEQPNDHHDCDICIIGGGSGGLSLAAGAAQLGAEIVLFEASKMGGDCLNSGCVPSKALLAAAKAAHYAKGAVSMGIHGSTPKIDFAAVKAHLAAVIDGIAPHDSVERFESLGVTVICEHASFTGRREAASKNHTVRAKYFVIATGSQPTIPPIDGLTDTNFHTNETIFADPNKPDHLVIIGGGPIGIEMAQAHVRLGVQVTVVEALSIMARDDAELVARLKARLQADGVRFIEGIGVSKVRQIQGREAQDSIRLILSDGTRLMASHLLVATGRRPVTDGMNLHAAGVDVGKTGITTDRRLRTSNKRIFAIGDVTGRQKFTHVAAYHASICLRNILFKLPAKIDDSAVPWVTFCDPELAHVGLTYDDAIASWGVDNVTVTSWDLADNDRARAELLSTGMVKATIHKNGLILGASILAPAAGEMIQPWTLAIANRRKINSLATMIAPYPTYGEASKRAAGNFFTGKLFSPRTQKLVRFLLKF